MTPLNRSSIFQLKSKLYPFHESCIYRLILWSTLSATNYPNYRYLSTIIPVPWVIAVLCSNLWTLEYEETVQSVNKKPRWKMLVPLYCQPHLQRRLKNNPFDASIIVGLLSMTLVWQKLLLEAKLYIRECFS